MSGLAIISHLSPTVHSWHPIQGGNINENYYLETSEGPQFLKVNHALKYPRLFETEQHGLMELQNKSRFTIPQPLKVGHFGESQYLVLKWLTAGKPSLDTWHLAGTMLANMHQQTQAQFGYDENNYLGTWLQDNSFQADWSQFYTSCRILPLVEALFNQGKLTPVDSLAAENFCFKLSNLFPPTVPALLHGDLWSGNFMITEEGQPCIFDPAVYYGHQEMDLGMTLLFGGFDAEFYRAYQANYPLDPGWENRLSFSQLYPLLLHAHLFGGSYIKTVKKVLGPFKK